MKNAYIFDLDGLLINSEIVSYKIYKRILEEYGFVFTKSEYSELYSGKTEIMNVKNLIKNYNLPASENAILEKVLLLEDEYIKKGIDLKYGAIELLDTLKNNNITIALATSSTKNRAIHILKHNSIFHYFQDFMFGEDVVNSKPHPEIYLEICNKLSEKKENCIILEDSEAGIEASYSAGVDVICIPDMKKPSEEHLSKCIAIHRSLMELANYLKKNVYNKL